MSAPLFSMDLPRLHADVRKMKQKFQASAGRAVDALKLAMAQYAEDTLSEARARAPVRTGLLRAKGGTDGPDVQGGTIETRVFFNLRYARIQDLGGTILPQRARALFIPLKPNVFPIHDPALRLQAGFRRGVDFILAKKATIKGNRYLTGTFEQRKSRAAAAIAERTGQILQAGAR